MARTSQAELYAELRASGHEQRPPRQVARGRWRARCACGWESRGNYAKGDTTAAHNEHLSRTLREQREPGA